MCYDVITSTSWRSGIHALRLLREVSSWHALVQEAISYRAAQLGLRFDCIGSPTGSPVVTHIRVNQSVKVVIELPKPLP